MRKFVTTLLLGLGSASAVTFAAGQNGMLTSNSNGYDYTVAPLSASPAGDVFLTVTQSKPGELSISCTTYTNLGVQGGENVIQVREFRNTGVLVALVLKDLTSTEEGKRFAAATAGCIESDVRNVTQFTLRTKDAIALHGNLRGYALKLNTDQYQRVSPVIEPLK